MSRRQRDLGMDTLGQRQLNGNLVARPLPFTSDQAVRRGHPDRTTVGSYEGARTDLAEGLLMVGVANRFEHHRVPFASVDYNLRDLGIEAGAYLNELIENGLKPRPGQSRGREIQPVPAITPRRRLIHTL